MLFLHYIHAVFLLVPLFAVPAVVHRRRAMYTPVPLLALLALLAAAFGLVPSMMRAQHIVHTLLAATLGASVLHLQVLARARLPMLILPGLLLVCATLLSFAPPQAHLAPILFLAFILTTLGTTLFLIIQNPFVPHHNAVSLTLVPAPPSPTSSHNSFRSAESHIEKPPRAVFPATPTRSGLWSTDPEVPNTPASARSTFKLSALYTPRRRRTEPPQSTNSPIGTSPTVHLFLLLAAQLSYTAATAFTVPIALLRAPPPVATLVAALIDSSSAHHKLDSASTFKVLDTTFTVLALLWTLGAYHYRSRCTITSNNATTASVPALNLERGTRAANTTTELTLPATPTPQSRTVRIYTPTRALATAVSNNEGDGDSPTHQKHKRTLPSSSSTSSFFSPRPKRAPLAVHRTVTTVTTTSPAPSPCPSPSPSASRSPPSPPPPTPSPSPRADPVLVIGSQSEPESDTETDEIPLLDLGLPTVPCPSPNTTSTDADSERYRQVSSSPTTTSPTTSSPVDPPVDPDLRIRMSPSPARRPTLVFVPPPQPVKRPHTYACPAQPYPSYPYYPRYHHPASGSEPSSSSPSSSSSSSHRVYDDLANSDAMADCTDLRDPFAPLPLARARVSAPGPVGVGVEIGVGYALRLKSQPQSQCRSVPVSRAGSPAPLLGGRTRGNINATAYMRGGQHGVQTGGGGGSGGTYVYAYAHAHAHGYASSASASASSSSSSNASTSCSTVSSGSRTSTSTVTPPRSHGQTCTRSHHHPQHPHMVPAAAVRTQTRMSTWGRLPLPLPLPLPFPAPVSLGPRASPSDARQSSSSSSLRIGTGTGSNFDGAHGVVVPLRKSGKVRGDGETGQGAGLFRTRRRGALGPGTGPGPGMGMEAEMEMEDALLAQRLLVKLAGGGQSAAG